MSCVRATFETFYAPITRLVLRALEIRALNHGKREDSIGRPGPRERESEALFIQKDEHVLISVSA